MLLRMAAIESIFFQRCCYLFAVRLAFIAGVPFGEGARFAPNVLNAVNAFLREMLALKGTVVARVADCISGLQSLRKVKA